MEESRPSYYAVIPADVRYDDSIPANAKLLYGEISALISADGFCFASNSYFMQIYGFSDPTISRLISQLEKAGYIKRELERDKSGQVVKRKIYLSVSVPQIQPPIKNDTTSPQKKGEGGIKNDGYTNTSITDIEKENKKEKAKALTDEELQALFIPWITDAAGDSWSRKEMNDLYLALVGFYAPRATKKQTPARTPAAFTALTNRLTRFSKGHAGLMVDMLERATTAGWKSVYAINDGSVPEAAGNRGDEEWLN